MKKVRFNIQKWGVRALVGLGAALGLSSCSNRINPPEAAYGPPPGFNRPQNIEIIEDLYGPPAEKIDTLKPSEPEPRPVVYGPPRG
ncbi:MAG: hypothetical protein IK100_01635 [Muribaculaceae bacterium]|nr:hypothetical protein [Muribaculaceae bacterium]MBR5117329.1 hypothetical protein [Muribaculaceae bacterium]